MAVAFANLLPKSAYGTYQFIMSFAAILAVLTLNMGIPVKRSTATGNDGALRFGFKTQLSWSIGIFILGAALSLYYFVNGNDMLGKALLIVGALTPFIGSFSLYKSFLHGKQKFKEAALLGLWLRPVLIITMLGALYFTDDPLILICVYFTTSFLSTYFLYARTVFRYKLPFTADKQSLNYGKHMSLMGIVTTIGTHAEKLLIFHFLGAVQVAIYTIAMLPTTHLLKLYTVAGDLIFPKFTRRTFETLQKSMLHKIGVVFALSVVIVSAFIALAPYIYSFIFPTYQESILLAQIGALALLTKFGNLFMQAFTAHEMKKEQYIVRFSSIAIKIILLFVLIPMFGLFGAVYAFLLTHLYWIVLSTIIFYTKRTVT